MPPAAFDRARQCASNGRIIVDFGCHPFTPILPFCTSADRSFVSYFELPTQLKRKSRHPEIHPKSMTLTPSSATPPFSYSSSIGPLSSSSSCRHHPRHRHRHRWRIIVVSASALFLGAAPPSTSTPSAAAVVGASSSSTVVSSTVVSAAAAGEGSILYPTTKTRSSLLATTATTRRPTNKQRMVTTRSSARQSAAPSFPPRGGGGGGGGGTTVVKSPAPPSPSSGIINVLFPIQSHELVKFLLIGTIKFFIVLALTLTRDGKDTLLVADCGAESIAFLKIYGVLPAATLFIATYSKLASVYYADDRKDLLFYITCIPFFVFFYIFDRAIYPHRESIQPSHDTVTSLLVSLFGGGRGDYHYNHDDSNNMVGGHDNGGRGGGAMTMVLAKLITHWTSALYYIIFTTKHNNQP